MCKQKGLESFYQSGDSSIKWAAILETGLGYLVRPFSGKYDTCK